MDIAECLKLGIRVSVVRFVLDGWFRLSLLVGFNYVAISCFCISEDWQKFSLIKNIWGYSQFLEIKH